MNLDTIHKKIAELELMRDSYARLELQRSEDRKRRDQSLRTKRVLRLMESLGLTIENLREYSTDDIVHRPSHPSGYKVAPKYRDPETGDTWTGRGKQPRWLQAKLAHGAHLIDEFKLPEAS
jgi:DNA-binding protein H-NS